MSVILNEGSVLLNGGNVATSEDCCCGGGGCECGVTIFIEATITAYACSSCSVFTGTISDSTSATLVPEGAFPCEPFFDDIHCCLSGCDPTDPGFCSPLPDVATGQAISDLSAFFNCDDRTVEVGPDWDIGCACCADPCTGCVDCASGGGCFAHFNSFHVLDIDTPGTYIFDDHVFSINFGGICEADIHIEITY